jgi:aminocarboxymuconate-semialdehyde decarboxylase
MVCLSHAGGALPFVIGRLQRGYDTSRPGVDTGAEPPRAAVRRLWFDSIAHDPACLRLVAEIAGEDRILLGSDLPFPMGDPDPMASLAAASASLPGLVVGPNTAALLAHLRRALHEIDI